MCTASLAETMAQSVCSLQPAIAIISWAKPSDSVTAIEKYWLIFVLEGRCNIFFAGSHALLYSHTRITCGDESDSAKLRSLQMRSKRVKNHKRTYALERKCPDFNVGSDALLYLQAHTKRSDVSDGAKL